MPVQPEYTIPVIVHRVYGRRNTNIGLAPRRGPSDDDQFFGEDGTVLGIEGSLRGNQVVIDRSHGTPRGWGEIRAMYVSDPSAPGSDGTTVNDFWAETGIRFEVVNEIDSMISSAFADFLPVSAPDWYAAILPLRRPGAINVFHLREMEGRWGNGRQYTPRNPDDIPLVLLSDRLDCSEGSGPTGRWQRVLVTLAHEFGHVLGLGHVQWIENVMYGSGTTSASRDIEAPQAATCRYRAAYISGAVALPVPRRPRRP